MVLKRLPFLVALPLIALTFVNAHSAPEFNPDKYASPTPSAPHDTNIQPLKLKTKYELPQIPEELKANVDDLTLDQLIDIALKNNPNTRYRWAIAKSKAAEWGVQRGAYYPSLDGNVTGNAGKMPAVLGGKSFIQTGLVLNYLLFDFGGRSASVESAKAALIAANMDHDQTIQDVLRNVPQAYYNYTGNKSLVQARVANLKEADTSLKAAEQRKLAGVATIADVLEARSNQQQAVYDLASAKGNVEISRGKLATSVGWPANTMFDTIEGPDDVPLKSIGEDVNQLIGVAREHRADLNASRATVKQQEAAIKQARSATLPKLVGTGNLMWTKPRDLDSQVNYYGGVQLSIPIFEGFTLQNKLRSARDQLKAATAQLERKEDEIIADVWNAYYNFRTSKEQLVAAKALLASAAESYNVSMARYKAGATDIVELMTQQSQLANARAQLVTTRMSYYNNYAEMIHSIGAEFSMASQNESSRE